MFLFLDGVEVDEIINNSWNSFALLLLSTTLYYLYFLKVERRRTF